MNILLSQIDMVIIEIIADVIMSSLTTMYYLGNGTVPFFQFSIKTNYVPLINEK